MMIQISLMIIALALLSMVMIFFFITLKMKSTIKLLEIDIHNLTSVSSELIERLNEIAKAFQQPNPPLSFKPLENLIRHFTKNPEKQSGIIPDGISWIMNGISLYQKTREVVSKYGKK